MSTASHVPPAPAGRQSFTVAHPAPTPRSGQAPRGVKIVRRIRRRPVDSPPGAPYVAAPPMNTRFFALGCFLSLLAPACVGEPLDTPNDEASAATASALSSTISAQQGALKLTFDTSGGFEDRPGGRV